MDTNKKQNTSRIGKRRRYTDEFKRDAVNRVLRTGKSCTKVGEELGINPNMLARWRREQVGDMDKASTPEEQDSADHGQPPWWADRAEYAQDHECLQAESGMGHGHHIYLVRKQMELLGRSSGYASA